MKDTVESTGYLGFIIAGAFIFGNVIAREQISADIARFFLGVTTETWLLLFLMNLLFLLLGCFIDTMVLLLIVTPIVLPVITTAGVDPVHFGVVIVLNMMIGLLTPPFGMLLFIISGISNTPMAGIIREVIPFIVVLIAVLAICTYVPDVVLFLPRALGY